jgi:hypothetical protein
MAMIAREKLSRLGIFWYFRSLRAAIIRARHKKAMRKMFWFKFVHPIF